MARWPLLPDGLDLFSRREQPLQPGDSSRSEQLSAPEQLRLLREFLALSQDAFVLIDPDTGRLLDCNTAACEQLGYGREAYLQLGLEDLQDDPEHDAAWLQTQVQLAGDAEVYAYRSQHRHSDGRRLPVEVQYRVLKRRGRPLVVARVLEASSEARPLRSGAERLHQLLLEAEQLTQVGSWELDHSTAELLWSDGVHRIFETSPERFEPSYEAFLAAIHPEDRELVDRTYRQALEQRQPYQVRHRICLPGGRQKVVEERGFTHYGPGGQPLRSIGTVQDISQLAAYEQQLERAAYVDPLTELPNRQAAIVHLQECLQQLQGGSAASGIGVFNLDLDQFQAFNDTYGPAVGDQLLQAVARCLREQLPASAFLARLDGDELLVVQPGSLEELTQLGRQWQQQLERVTGTVQSLPLLPSVSIGIAHGPSHGLEPLPLLQAANTALMEAKRHGKGSIGLYSSAISQRIRHDLKLDADLAQAIQQQAFRLAFQPQVDRQGALVGAEVLLRLQDRYGSPIPPDVFIPAAERSGQIHAISAWVVEESCRQLQGWRQQGLQVPRLAINLSAVQFGQASGGLSQTLIEVVHRHGLEPEALELEITETALMADPERSRAETLALSRAGFQLAIDDFGTGYASLMSLHTLPVNTIKIDLSFVERLRANPADQAIVKSIIRMAHELGLVALAEGVETSEQWQILLELGCDRFQGYLFGYPIAAEAFEEQLRAAPRALDS